MDDANQDDIDEDEDDWLDTRWAEPDGNGSVGDYGKIFKSHTHCQTQSSVQTHQHTGGGQVSTVSGKGAGGDKALLTRMQLNDNKAGMEGLDKEKINQIIYEASKGSKYFENEKKREEQVQHRINEQQAKWEKITETQLKQGLEEADKLLAELEASRDLTHTIVHIDMDAFYAAVEMRDDPSLRDKPMAVGGSAMLSTSNYIARKFGVRAAMPGFIGKKLCPDLVIVKANYKQYTADSQQIRQILEQYDPNFCPMSLDEAYLDITEHLKKRELLSETERSYLLRSCDTWETTLCLCDLNEVLHSDRLNISKSRDKGLDSPQPDTVSIDMPKPGSSNQNFENEGDRTQNDSEVKNIVQNSAGDVCKVCGKPFPPYTVAVFGTTVEEAVREMRSRIQQKTRLTASAGIAPNTMLAKVCSDRNKPNGQYRIQPVRQEVMDFIRDLPIRKISGIGKVSETMLRAVGVAKCQDLYEKRDLLYHLYSPISFHYFMRICLAISSTTVERDGDRKSISTERTFNELSRPSDLYKKCSDLCTALVEDLVQEELRGKTVSIKIKTVKFEVKTRAHTLRHHTAEFSDIFTAARELLRVEIQAVQPQPLRLRLMGVRMSNLLHQSECEVKRQDTITGMFKKMAARSPQKTQKGTSAVVSELDQADLPQLPSMDAVLSGSRDDKPLALTNTDAEQFQDVPSAQVKAENTNSTKLKSQKKGRNGNKSVKLLFKPKAAGNSDDTPDKKEINNNTVEESNDEISKTEKSLDNMVSASVKEKRKPGRKKAKVSVSNNVCMETVNMITPTDGSGESGYESSKPPEENKVKGIINNDNCNGTEDQASSSEKTGHSDEDDQVAAGSSNTHEAEEVQKLKLFQCPVCQREVECKNLNYFNDHVDVCLFRQISSQEQKEQSQFVCNQPESSCLKKTDMTETQVFPSFENRIQDSKQELGSGKVVKECNPEQIVQTLRKTPSESNTSPLTRVQFESGKSPVLESDEKLIAKRGSLSPDPCQAPEEHLTGNTEEVEFYSCPICNVEKIGCSLEEFNEHVDSCLSRQAIKQILDEQKKLSPVQAKRPSSSLSQAPPAKKKRRESGGQMKTIDSFFKS